MAKHQWSVLCKRCIIDKDDNTTTLVDVIEEVSFIELKTDKKVLEEKASPAIIAKALGFQLVTLWIRSEYEKTESAKARIEVKSPSGKSLIKHEYDVDLKIHPRYRQKLNFQGIPFTGYGEYIYKVQLDKGIKNKSKWTTVAELSLYVKEQEKPKH